MKEKIEFRKIREFDRLISDTLLFVKQTFRPLLKSVLYLSGFFIVGGMISSVFTQMQIDSLTQDFQDGNYNENVSAWSSLFGWRYLLLIVFAILNYTALYTSVLSFIALYVAKGNVVPNVEEVWSYFKHYFFRIMWTGILVTIIWAICFVCCFIPGIYVTPAFFIFYSVMILENVDFSTAFSRVFSLVKNNWWMTFATIFVVLIITMVCSFIVLVPSYIVTMISTFSHQGQALQKGYQIFIAVSQYLSQIFMIIPLVSSAFIYYNLVERKESTGLLERIANFGQGTAAVHHPEEDY